LDSLGLLAAAPTLSTEEKEALLVRTRSVRMRRWEEAMTGVVSLLSCPQPSSCD
jgi:hypothetical protein